MGVIMCGVISISLSSLGKGAIVGVDDALPDWIPCLFALIVPVMLGI